MASLVRPRAASAQASYPDTEEIAGDDPNVSLPTTVGGTALPNVVSGSTSFLISIETFPVRFRPTASGNPSTANGILLPVGGPYDITFDPSALKFIGIGGTAIANVIYKS